MPTRSFSLCSDHIILIGMKYAGKSSLGKILAEELSRPFLDLDHLVEQRYVEGSNHQLRGNKSYQEIWKEEGEETFRYWEEMALCRLFRTPEQKTNQSKSPEIPPPFILATGGGSPLYSNNRKYLLQPNNFLIYLEVSEEELLRRIQAHGLPSFFPPDQPIEKTLRQLLAERNPIYKSLAQLRINNSTPLRETISHLLELLHYPSEIVSP